MKNNKENLVSIIILSYNQVEFTKNCLESIREYTTIPYEIIMIDNASSKETIEFLNCQQDIRLVKNETNLGFAGGCNQGMKLAKGNFLLLLNNDTIVTPGYLEHMITVLEKEKDAGIVGPYTNNTIGRQKLDIDLDYERKKEIIQYGKKVSEEMYAPVNVARLIGFCMLFRKSFVEDVGMFDEIFKIGNYEDDDLCIRALKKQYKLYICNNSFVYHYKRATFDKNKMDFENISQKNKLILEQKWSGFHANHYFETNSFIENKLLSIKPHTILHIGCGLGALGIAVKQQFPCYYVGADVHRIRCEIASQYVDKLVKLEKIEDLCKIERRPYDVIVIEEFVERFGLFSLELVKDFISDDTRIFIRVFNANHISTIESMTCGKIWGNTIGAASPEFSYRYGELSKKLEEIFEMSVINCVEVKKTFKKEQEKLYKKFMDYPEFLKESMIYNRIYELKKI